jgi:AraC family transcriptional regulator, transcriptional activator of pobA
MTRQAQRLSSQSAKSVPVLDPNNDGVGGRRPSGLSTEFFDRAKAQSGILSAPSFLYGEDKPGAIFGFFHIETLSARSNLEERQHGLHRHPDFDQLLIMTRGGCGFEHDGRESEVAAPCCVYTPANVVHRFFYRPDADGVIVSVSSDFVAGLSSAEQAAITTMLRLGARRVIRFRTAESVVAAQGLIDLTLDKFASRHPNRCDIVRYLFSGLLLELAAAVEVPSHGDPRTVNAMDLFRRFNDLIQETIGAIGFGADVRPPSNTVESFASRLSTTPYALNAACQTVCGCSARDFIHTAILDQATRLLLYTTRPMKDISYLLGYSHASHFSRFFKQRRGTTPEAFRSQAPRDKWIELPPQR